MVIKEMVKLDSIALLSSLVDEVYMVAMTMNYCRYKDFALDRAIEEGPHYKLLYRMVQ